MWPNFLQTHICQLGEHRCRAYLRQQGVMDAESWLRGEVLIRDEVDPDLTALGRVIGWYRLWPAPATQDGLLSQILNLHKVIPSEVEREEISFGVNTRHFS